jgi:hypothetical protein
MAATIPMRPRHGDHRLLGMSLNSTCIDTIGCQNHGHHRSLQKHSPPLALVTG